MFFENLNVIRLRFLIFLSTILLVLGIAVGWYNPVDR